MQALSQESKFLPNHSESGVQHWYEPASRGASRRTLTGAEAVVEMLKAHGVEILFGLCGDTSLPFYDALARLRHGMRHVSDARRALGSLHGGRLCARLGQGRRLRGAQRRRRDLYPSRPCRGERILGAGALHQLRHLRRGARALHPHRARSGRAHASGDEMERGARPRSRTSRAFSAPPSIK